MTAEAELEKAKEVARTVEQEAIFAVQLHETWRPTVSNTDLLERMGTSYATHSFLIIRNALRREVVLALMRLWDRNPRTASLVSISGFLGNTTTYNALVEQRAKGLRSDFDVKPFLRETLNEKRDAFIHIFNKHKDNKRPSIIARLRTLRNEHLAHRQAHNPTDSTELSHSDEEVEQFYQETLELVRLTLSLFLGKHFDIAADAGNVYKFHAKYFWAPVRGERTEGHPNYLAPLAGDDQSEHQEAH
ncbi:AbiU2 domain-containing protein [Chitinibacteraceae bacterium HSL-7]